MLLTEEAAGLRSRENGHRGQKCNKDREDLNITKLLNLAESYKAFHLALPEHVSFDVHKHLF